MGRSVIIDEKTTEIDLMFRKKDTKSLFKNQKAV